MSRLEAYGYAVARIRAMERQLLDSSALARLLDAEDLAGALKILGETSYAKGFAKAGEGARYDLVLEEELLSAYAELQTFVPDKELIDLCRMQYDFHNVKVLLKSIFNAREGGKKRWDLLTSLGTTPKDSMIEAIESEDFALLPFNLGVIVPLCVSRWEQTRDTVEVERMLDEQMFAAMLVMAENLGGPGIVAWVRARIDCENLRNLLRLKRFGLDQSNVSSFLHKGGTISPELLLSLLPEPFDSWGRSLAFSDVGLVVSSLTDSGGFDSLIASLERALDDYCGEVVGKARYSSDAPENVLAYLWGKEMEVKNIRAILVAKGMNADREEVRRSLRHGYQ